MCFPKSFVFFFFLNKFVLDNRFGDIVVFVVFFLLKMFSHCWLAAEAFQSNWCCELLVRVTQKNKVWLLKAYQVMDVDIEDLRNYGHGP